MHVLLCVDEGADSEVVRAIGGVARVTRTLDPAVIENMLLTGAAWCLIIDPQAVPAEMLARVSATVVRTSSRVVLWTTLSRATIAPILAANRTPYHAVVLRDREDRAVLLRRHLVGRGVFSAPAALLRRLAPTMRLLPVELAADVLTVLLARPSSLSVAFMLDDLRIKRRKFERALGRAGLCTVNALRHLGRILEAFDHIALRGERVDSAATKVEYADASDLRKHSRKYVGCVPSRFGTAVSVQQLAARIVDAINDSARRERAVVHADRTAVAAVTAERDAAGCR